MASVHWRMHKRLGQKLIGWEQKALKSWWLHWGMRRLGDPVTGFVLKIKMYCQFMEIIIGKMMIGGSKLGDNPIRPNNVKLKLWRKGMISIDPLQVAGWWLQLSPFFFTCFSIPQMWIFINLILCWRPRYDVIKLSGSAQLSRMDYENGCHFQLGVTTWSSAWGFAPSTTGSGSIARGERAATDIGHTPIRGRELVLPCSSTVATRLGPKSCHLPQKSHQMFHQTDSNHFKSI